MWGTEWFNVTRTNCLLSLELELTKANCNTFSCWLNSTCTDTFTANSFGIKQFFSIEISIKREFSPPTKRFLFFSFFFTFRWMQEYGTAAGKSSLIHRKRFVPQTKSKNTLSNTHKKPLFCSMSAKLRQKYDDEQYIFVVVFLAWKCISKLTLNDIVILVSHQLFVSLLSSKQNKKNWSIGRKCLRRHEMSFRNH